MVAPLGRDGHHPPGPLGQPFTRWSVRKLVGYLADNPRRIVRIGRGRARRLLAAHEITFQRTKTWKESPDPAWETKLARIEEILEQHPDRTFALRRVRPADHPTGARSGMGAARAAGELPQDRRGAVLPRLLAAATPAGAGSDPS